MIGREIWILYIFQLWIFRIITFYQGFYYLILLILYKFKTVSILFRFILYFEIIFIILCSKRWLLPILSYGTKSVNVVYPNTTVSLHPAVENPMGTYLIKTSWTFRSTQHIYKRIKIYWKITLELTQNNLLYD